MKDTILLVGHGSREGAGNIAIEKFATQLRQRQPNWHIEVCFIEFAPVLLKKGFDHAAAHAATATGKVLVLPLILNAAGHMKGDIPRAMQAARERHPHVQFDCAPHVGANDTMLQIVRRNLTNAMAQLDVPDPSTTGVIVLGRGSSDRKANGEMAKMARWLWEECDHELVDLAFTGITYPRLERVVQRQVQLGMSQIVVLPYYLFTGTLLLRIERQMQHLAKQYPQVRFAHSGCMGFEPELFDLLAQRVEKWHQGEPHSVVRYNPADAAHHHHHHDDEHGHDHSHDHEDHHHHHHEDGHDHHHPH